ncbi:MAG: type II toxin-antitoxin system prevent-host-death family antitoxin [Proteobacteria bacterium]|nr:type II toxin-antitoxin system prevent-host-death family antitoxin [Pseudomonadota bacterium]
MQAVSFSELRKDMKHIMDRTKDRHEPLIITRKSGNMVMMSLEDYNALEETAYILSNPKNAQRILSSIAELRAGKGQVHALIED